MNLVRNARRISLELNLGTANAAAEKDGSADAVDPKKLAFQQGRLAVAVLGGTTRTPSGAAVCCRGPSEPTWQGDLDTAGDDIGRGFQNLARIAKDDADKARKGPTAAAAKPLRQAALADARFLDAGEADAWLAYVDPGGGEPLRTAARPPRPAGEADVRWTTGPRSTRPTRITARPASSTPDARDLAVGAAELKAGAPDLKDEEKEARLAEAKHVETVLKKPDAFAFRWLDGGTPKADPETIHITDEPSIQFRYGLAGPAGRAGRPAGGLGGPRCEADCHQPAGRRPAASLDRVSDAAIAP